MKEILGNNLDEFFFSLDYSKECVVARTYKSDRYEVWSMPDEVFDIISDMSNEKFVKLAGEDAWWRSSTGSVLYSLDNGEVLINNRKMIAWIENTGEERISEDKEFDSLSEYLCCFVGVSMPCNVVACAMDLAKFNNMTMGQLFSKYEPVED